MIKLPWAEAFRSTLERNKNDYRTTCAQFLSYAQSEENKVNFKWDEQMRKLTEFGLINPIRRKEHGTN